MCEIWGRARWGFQKGQEMSLWLDWSRRPYLLRNRGRATFDRHIKVIDGFSKFPEKVSTEKTQAPEKAALKTETPLLFCTLNPPETAVSHPKRERL